MAARAAVRRETRVDAHPAAVERRRRPACGGIAGVIEAAFAGIKLAAIHELAAIHNRDDDWLLARVGRDIRRARRALKPIPSACDQQGRGGGT
jgi:hypothetical protein